MSVAESFRGADQRLWFGGLFLASGVAVFRMSTAAEAPAGVTLLAFWALTSLGAFLVASHRARWVGVVLPVALGATILGLWEMAVHTYDISPVILPAPSSVGTAIAANIPTLWVDFVQTILRGALVGYVLGCGIAILAALAIDRSPFLQKGLLPVGNFIAALPIVGTAPILVMWYGFGPSSKVAVVVAMVFFPMLVNAVQGLKTSDAIQRDLMHTYAASYWQTLFKLRLPTAMPFLFNGLKICSTLALIGAIVAEFFGSPTVGMGFRIKIEVGRLAMDMVWAEITVAALAGSGLYGLMALAEKLLTFWHPSQRSARA